MAKKYSLEIVIPIYNEQEELEANIKKLHSFLRKNLYNYNWQITIADNASTDKSLAITKDLAKKLTGVSFFHFDKKGRGGAVKRVWSKSNADILCYMDVDLSTDLINLPTLLSAILKGYDIAIGSRLLPKSKVANRTLKREILSRVYNILIKFTFRTHFSDAQCGFKAIKKRAASELLPKIIDDAWFFDSELLILADKMGYKIYEAPVKWIDNPGSTVRVLKTVFGDLSGLWRLFRVKPWNNLKG